MRSARINAITVSSSVSSSTNYTGLSVATWQIIRIVVLKNYNLRRSTIPFLDRAITNVKEQESRNDTVIVEMYIILVSLILYTRYSSSMSLFSISSVLQFTRSPSIYLFSTFLSIFFLPPIILLSLRSFLFCSLAFSHSDSHCPIDHTPVLRSFHLIVCRFCVRPIFYTLFLV